jgi:ADP-heptose:LPS heptosyltransferase
MTRTLIVYLHGIGDNIMLTGVLKAYCRNHPDETVDLVVLNPGCEAIWKNNPLVNSVLVYPCSQPHFWNPVKFYLVHRPRLRRYIRKLNHDGRWQRVYFPAIQTFPEILFHVTGTYGRHKMERICRELELPAKLHPYDLHTTAEDAATAETLLQKYEGIPLAVLHPFSGHAKKRISAAGFGKILAILRAKGFTPLVVGSEAEKTQFDTSWPADSLFGLSLGVLIEVLKRANIFAGTDSAVAHLAAFANTPKLIIFSPKLEPRRYLPISEHSYITIIRIKAGPETSSLEAFQTALDSH